MAKNNAFNNYTIDLGDSHTGIDKLGVDSIFDSYTGYSNSLCIVCNTNTPSHKMIPQHKHLDTAEIQDKGYVCDYCLSVKAINPLDFKLQPLR